MDAVSRVIAGRAHVEEGLGSMLGASALAHLVLLVAVALMPPGWLAAPARPEELVMTISLGGPVGPRDGGMTPMGGRPVQEVVEATPRREAVRPPAPVAPQMVEPLPRPAPKRPAVAQAPREARGTTPARGEQVQRGSAVADTGGRGQGFGLTTGGGGTGATLDVGSFCCPDYLVTMQQLIQRNWNARQQVTGTTVITFVIQRDGTLTDIRLRQSSGFAALDFAAQRALALTQRLPPLPGEYPEPTLTVHLSFNYER